MAYYKYLKNYLQKILIKYLTKQDDIFVLSH